MSLVALVLVLVVVGVLIYFVNLPGTPIHPRLKMAINWVVGICVLWFVLDTFGVLPALYSIKVPRIHG